MQNTAVGLSNSSLDYNHLLHLISSLQVEMQRLEDEGHEIVKHLHDAINKEKLQHVVNTINNIHSS